MDLFVASLVSIVVILLLLLSFIIPKRTSTANLPPGKFGWPLIGETVDFGMPGRAQRFVADRMNLYSRHVFKTSLLGEKMAVFCGHAGNKFIFSNENKLVKSWYPRSVAKLAHTDSDPRITEEINKWRRVQMEFLKPEAIQKYIQTMDIIVKQHLEQEWAPNATLKVHPTVRRLTFFLSCRFFLGIEDPGETAALVHQYEDLAKGIFALPIDFPGTDLNRAMKASKVFRSELGKIIQRQKAGVSSEKDSGARHLLSHLLSATDDEGKFVSEGVISTVILFALFASVDTTSSTLTSLVYYLIDNPHAYQEVLREQLEIAKLKGAKDLLTWEDTSKMKYSRNFVHEVLRLAPPSPGTFREAIHDITYEGFTIPKGWKIHWSTNSTHRDPKYFPDPEKFNPTRFEEMPVPFSFTPFGGGPRMCPGREFALHVLLVFLHNLVMRFECRKLDQNEKIIFVPYPRHPNGLPIKILRRDR